MSLDKYLRFNRGIEMGTIKCIAGISGVFKGKNFMTPKVLGFYQCGDYVVELSTGSGKNLA